MKALRILILLTLPVFARAEVLPPQSPRASARGDTLLGPSVACSLFVGVGGDLSGCEELRADPRQRTFFRTVTDRIAIMREAWSKRKAKDIFPVIKGEDPLRGLEKKSLARALDMEMDQTISVDSMAAIIGIVDVGGIGRRIVNEYHVARRVRRGKVRSEMFWARYSEDWIEHAEGWHLRRVTDGGSGHVPLAAGALGLLMASPEYKDPQYAAKGSARRVFRPPQSDQVLSWKDVPGDLAAGDEIGPFALNCSSPQGQFIYYEGEPRPITTDDAVRIVEYREDATVVLRVLVCESGEVGWIRVDKGSPPTCAEAVAGVSRWRFSPATSNGKTLAVWIELELVVSDESTR